MLLARVEGSVWGARQAGSLQGSRLLVLRPLTARASGSGGSITVDADQQTLEPAAHTLVAVDRLGAGPGELVLVAHGSRCRDLTMGPELAAKEVVLAIVDRAQVTVEGRR